MRTVEIDEQTEAAVEEREFAINLYPLLGLTLVVGVAVLVYGVLFYA